MPSDGVDQFATVANQLADDTASIDTWWASQDPTRDLRFDQAVFSACTGLDISFLKLPDTAAQVSSGGAENAFGTMLTLLQQAGFTNPYKRYLVYYDGPAPEVDVCGTGGGDFATGPGYAIVWLAGLPGRADGRDRRARACCTRSARCRTATLTPVRATRRTCATTRSTSSIRTRPASRSRRSSSTSTTTTTTATPARGPTFRTRRGCICCRCREEALGVAFSGAGHVTGNLPGHRLHRVLRHAVGPGRNGDAARRSRAAAPVRRLAGRLHRSGRLHARPSRRPRTSPPSSGRTRSPCTSARPAGEPWSARRIAPPRSPSASRSTSAPCRQRAGGSPAGPAAAPARDSRAPRRPKQRSACTPPSSASRRSRSRNTPRSRRRSKRSPSVCGRFVTLLTPSFDDGPRPAGTVAPVAEFGPKPRILAP